jgi:uncharacterized protein
VVKESLISRNGVFVIGLILGSLASALAAGDFRPSPPRATEAVSLGGTVGVLLSGIMAGALWGWVFAAFCLLGVWLGWRGRQALPPAWR